MASSPLSISERCHAIKESLNDSRGVLSDPRKSDVSRKTNDLIARFELWAGNLGAFHPPWHRLSLDSRIAQSPEIREVVIQHLENLEQASSELKAELEAQSSPQAPTESHYEDIDRDSSPVDECGILIEVMSQSLAFLFRLAVLVKTHGADNRWTRALQRTEPFPDHFDYSHIISKYPYLDTENGMLLARRVAQANVQRRQFIQYCRDHISHLTETRVSAINDGATERLSSTATTLPSGMDLNILSAEELDDDTESLMTASTTFDSNTKLRLPPLSNMSPSGEAFQCPICSTLKKFDREKAWKKHAYQDLRAYCCTIGGKDCGSKMFGDRKSWFDHEIKQHRSWFTCTLCNKQLSGKDATTTHIKSSHGIVLSDQLSMLAESGRTVPSHFKASDCPFCDWPLERHKKRTPSTISNSGSAEDEKVSRAELKRHIAVHQEQLALFVAPLPDGSADDDIDSNSEEDIIAERQGQ